MEHRHSQSAINIVNVNQQVLDKNDKLSVMSMKKEDTNISSNPRIDDKNSIQISSSGIDITPKDERIPPMSHHSFYENQQISDRTSGIAKSIPMTSGNSFGTKRINAALEKNLETIVTQTRRAATKPSQLTQNDLELFDNTSSTNTKNGSNSREMTPDSINTDSANEESIPNEHYYHHSNIPDPYAQALWPPPGYPMAHQHLGLYLPYPPPTNGSPSFYPPYDPVLIEQHYNLSAYYTQQQAVAARFLQEHASLPDNVSPVLTTPTKEYSSSINNKSTDSITNTSQKKNTLIHKSSLSFHRNLETINGSLSRLSPDLLSNGDGGGTNDADSIISLDSIKSNTAISMPVLEDGLSDSENISGDEHSPPVLTKSTSTQSDSNRTSLIPSHKHQFPIELGFEPRFEPGFAPSFSPSDC